MSIHIKHYLLGRAEFETTINHITVDFRSFLHHFSTINLALALALDAANLAYQPGDEPLPSTRDVGSVDSASAPSKARMQPHPPLPFQRDVGGLVSWMQPHLPLPFQRDVGGFSSCVEGIGDGGGGTGEAHMVCHKSLTPDAAVTNRTQMTKPADAHHPPSLMTTASTTTTTLPWTTTTIIDDDHEESECPRD